jgi:hypothetical protein
MAVEAWLNAERILPMLGDIPLKDLTCLGVTDCYTMLRLC